MNETAVETPAPKSAGGPAIVLKAYWDLTKPRIIGLLLVTTYAAMLIAAGEVPSWSLIFFTLLGGALTSGSANAINMVYDRDIDQVMRRTSWRPLPSGRIGPRHALAYAILVGLVGAVELAYFVNPLASLLAVFGNLFYVFVYTMWLKRNSVQNIVIGGAAGAVPPLVGWAAVTGSLDWGAFILFMIVFLWTPPHFWALALYKNDDYRAANIPMMPVIRGKDVTIKQMLIYCLILLPTSLALVFALPMTFFYFFAALILGAVFTYFGLKVAQRPTDRNAKSMFAYSIVYLGLIFGAMVVDRLVMADMVPPMIPARGVSGLPIDTSRDLMVVFGGDAADDVPFKVEASMNTLGLHPNERKELSYRVTNTGSETITAMADHDIQPPEAAGFFKKVDCFCFKEQTIGPGETVELPLVFSFVDALPSGIERISVNYTFKRIGDDGLPAGEGEPQDSNHDHAH